MVALLGPNGAGKSTLMRVLASAESADEGQVRVLGCALPRERTAVRARLAVVFQQPALDRSLSGQENLRVHAALAGVRGGAARERIGRLSALLGVEDRLRDRVGTLSGGLARRVDLARALVSEPELLLMDEPTAGLDAASREAFVSAVASWRGRTGGTVVLVTHELALAARADALVVLKDGRVEAVGAPGALCATLGERFIEVADAHASGLEREGVRRVAVGGGQCLGLADARTAAVVAGELMRKGVAVRVGVPGVEEVYRVALAGAGMQRGGDDGGVL